MKNHLSYLGLVIAVLVTSCAQQSTPSGGERDSESPKIAASEPLNFSLNYVGNSIELKFDEFVQINSLKEQLVITPSLKFPPEFQLSGKKLKITFIDSLKPNTTYQFNFGEGIMDITESNLLDSNLFIFSTGNYIDSLFIRGQVKDAFTLAPTEGILVMLYEDETDSIPFKERPTYFSKTNKQGFFDIAYLPDGAFKLVAIKDENANYLFDPQLEEVSFIEKQVSSSDTIEYLMYMFNEALSNQYIRSVSSNEYGKITFVFNEPTVSPSAKLIGQSFKKQWYIEDLNKTKDTLIYWITEPVDTLLFEIVDEETIVDTVDVIMMPKPKEKQWAEKKLRVSISAKKAGEIELYNPLFFKGQYPIVGYDEKLILLVENEKDTVPVTLKSDDIALRKYYFEHEWQEASTYSLTIFPGAFLDVFGLLNDTIQATFKTPTWNKYADVNLKVELPTDCKSGVVQLHTPQRVVLQENNLSKNGTIKYEHLKPGKYSLKMIYDENQNGKWDTGNLLNKIQPEKVIYYSGVIEVRSGWDVDLIWKIGG